MNCPSCDAPNTSWATCCACGERLASWPYVLGIVGGIVVAIGSFRVAVSFDLRSDFWRECCRAVVQLAGLTVVGCWVQLCRDPRAGPAKDNGGDHYTDFSDSDCGSDGAGHSCGSDGDHGGGDW